MLIRLLRRGWPLLCLASWGCPIVGAERLDAIRDADGDGLDAEAFGGTDCDDASPAIRGPRAEWPDRDGDGFGDHAAADHPARTCGEVEPGFADNAGDCDDADPTLSPLTPWYPDVDGDGYGDAAAAPLASCEGHGRVREPTDCDDRDPSVHPGAGPDLPHDGVDQDCDGRTDLDEDGDGRADLDGLDCAAARDPIVVHDQAGLLEALAAARDCDQIELDGPGPFGSAQVAASVALIAAPGARPVFSASVAGATALRLGPGVRSLTLERLTFEGFDDTVALGPDTSLLGSELSFSGGPAIVTATGDAVTLYDSRFTGAETALSAAGKGQGPDRVKLERVEVSLGVTDGVLLLGGAVDTELDDLTLRDTGAQDALISVPSGGLTMRHVRVEGSLGQVLHAEPTGAVVLDDVVVRGNASVSPQLVSLRGPLLAPENATVTGLVVEGNAWRVEAPDTSPQALIESDYAFVLIRNLALTMRSSRIVANETAPFTALLSCGDVEPSTFTPVDLQSSVFAGTWDGTPGVLGTFGSVGVVVYGHPEDKHLSHLTFSRLQSFAVVSITSVDLRDTIVDRVGAVFPPSAAPVAFTMSHSLTNATEVLGAPCADCVSGEPLFVRDAPSLDATLQDHHLLAASPALLDGDELGATGGDGGDGASYARDADGDGLPDGWEAAWCDGRCAAEGDHDRDGVSDPAELALGTLPGVADSDRDGTPDGADAEPLVPAG